MGVQTAEECVHRDVNGDDVPIVISKRWSITGARETVICIPVGHLEGQERRPRIGLSERSRTISARGMPATPGKNAPEVHSPTQPLLERRLISH